MPASAFEPFAPSQPTRVLYTRTTERRRLPSELAKRALRDLCP